MTATTTSRERSAIAWSAGALTMIALAGAAASAEDPKDQKDTPHPVIMEVLFHVPTGSEGDANKDGRRDSTGDEFVELMNPTNKPIQMKGYRLSSRLSTFDAESRYGIRFIFPEFELPAKGVVVVFNGHDASIAGEVGNAEMAPERPNRAFGDAFVFSMETTAQNLAFKNGGDFVLLTAPDGRRIDCVVWGKSDPGPPADAARTEDIGSIRPGGSVQRVTPDGPLRANKDFDSRPFSPGEIPGA